MKLTCSCGIDYQIYDYPGALIQDSGKEVIERHIMCPCDRELVIRTQPKYEPSSNPGEDTSGVVSFDELVRRLNQPNVAAAPAGVTWGGKPTVSKPSASKPAPAPVVAPSAPPSIIADINAATAPVTQEKSIFLAQDDADVLGALVAHYGEKFKDAEVQKEEAQEFADLASRCKQEGMFIITTDKEERMIRTAFLERNIKKLWPVGQYDDETDFNVVQSGKAKSLREKFKALCAWEDRR